jgi:Mn2+/Fe2+ NRAMP family transporter
LNGICAPFLLVLILLISNNKKIMGNRTNSLISNIGGIAITAIMTIASVALLLSTVGVF